MVNRTAMKKRLQFFSHSFLLACPLLKATVLLLGLDLFNTFLVTTSYERKNCNISSKSKYREQCRVVTLSRGLTNQITFGSWWSPFAHNLALDNRYIPFSTSVGEVGKHYMMVGHHPTMIQS